MKFLLKFFSINNFSNLKNFISSKVCYLKIFFVFKCFKMFFFWTISAKKFQNQDCFSMGSVEIFFLNLSASFTTQTGIKFLKKKSQPHVTKECLKKDLRRYFEKKFGTLVDTVI